MILYRVHVTFNIKSLVSHTYTHMHTHTHIYTHMHMCIQTHTHTHTQTHTQHTRMHTQTHTCMHNPIVLYHIIVTTDMVECVEMKKQFRDFLVTKLRKAYSEVVSKLIDIFKNKKVDIQKLITVLSFDAVDDNSVFSSDAAFSTIRTEIQLFHHVSKYCKGIYDYRVLDVLVKASGCPEAIKELTDFTELLKNSILAEIDLMSEHGELLHPDDFFPGTYKFIIEYVGGKCTIETKEMVQGIVEQSVRLRKGALIFKGIDLGSILFIYQISETVKNYLLQYKFTEQDVRFLEGNNITSLIVDGIRIMTSSQPTKVSLAQV